MQTWLGGQLSVKILYKIFHNDGKKSLSSPEPFHIT